MQTKTTIYDRWGTRGTYWVQVNTDESCSLMRGFETVASVDQNGFHDQNSTESYRMLHVLGEALDVRIDRLDKDMQGKDYHENHRRLVVREMYARVLAHVQVAQRRY